MFERQSLWMEVWEAVKHSSTMAVMGAIFSLPAVGTIYFVERQFTGFVLIATTAMISQVVLRSLDSDGDTEDIDVSDLTPSQVKILLLAMFGSIFAAVTVKLVLAASVAGLVTSTTGAAIVGVGIAASFPFVDRKLAATHRYLSVSAITALLVLSAISVVIDQNESPSGVSQDAIKQETLELSM